MSRANRHSDSVIDPNRGTAAFKHDPTMDPTILLYLFISFNFNSMSSHSSNERSASLISMLSLSGTFNEK